MKATATLLGVLLLAGLARAQSPYPVPSYPQAPEGYGADVNDGGCASCRGHFHLWHLLPHFRHGLPAADGPMEGAGPVSFPTHPFARSPRDFFMWTEASEDQAYRLRLPALVP